MAKTLAEKSIELVEANATLTAANTELTAKFAAVTAQCETAKAEIDAANARATDAEGKLAVAEAEKLAVATERDTLVAKVNEMSKTLALHPDVKQSSGADAVKTGVAQGDGPQSWQQAVAACGGDYVLARKNHGELFTKLMESQAK